MFAKNVIVTGALAFDSIFNIPDPFTKYILPDQLHKINVSIVTNSYRKTLGGTGGNQVYYLARLGMNPYLVATAGHDFSDYKKFLVKNKVRINFVNIIKTKSTAAGFAMTDPKDNQIWMFAQGAMQDAKNLSLVPIFNKVKNPFVIIAPNELQAIVRYVNECADKKIPFAFDPAFFIPHLEPKLLLKAVKSAQIIFGNDYEIEFIERKIGNKLIDILSSKQILVKTLGEKGSRILNNKKWINIGINKTKAIDPTGAGDAYRAGFLFGYLRNNPLKVCGWMGAVVSSFAVEVKGTMNLDFTKGKFKKLLAKINL